MKNRIFKFLSLEEKQKVLMHVLRDRTECLLKANEEAGILAAISLEKQFRIRMYHDVNVFCKDTEISKGIKGEVIVGSIVVKDLARPDFSVDEVIALIKHPQEDPNGMNQLYIYIPQSRICSRKCVHEQFSCEYLEQSGETLSCNLHTVRA